MYIVIEQINFSNQKPISTHKSFPVISEKLAIIYYLTCNLSILFLCIYLNQFCNLTRWAKLCRIQVSFMTYNLQDFAIL